MNSRRVSFCLIAILACSLARGEDLFFRQHSYKCGGGTQSVCVADFNGDGRKDMATADLAQSTVSIVMAQADGTFVRTAIDLGLPGNPFMVAAGDINGDGRVDLVASKFQDAGGVAIMIGNGNGTFQAPVHMNTQGGKGTSICLGDVNGDGRLDLVVCCSTTYRGVEVYFGNGNGTFTFSSKREIQQSLFDMVLADLNGDGKLDIAIANYLGANATVLLNAGNGTFNPDVRYTLVESRVRGIAAGDFDGDGRIDLVTVNEGQHAARVLRNLGNGTFETNGGLKITVGQEPYGVKTADINGDGRLDFVTAGKFSNSITVVLGNGNGTFGTPSIVNAGSGPMGLAIDQLVADSKLDVVTANSVDGSVLILPGKGDGTFLTLNTFPTGNDSQTIVQADLNADGKMDFITANKQPSTVSVLLGNGNGTVAPAVHYSTGTSSMPTACAAGDINGDGRIDIVASRSGTGGVAVLLGNGNGTLQAATSVTTGNITLGVQLADINADAKLDLIVMSSSTRSIEVYPGNGNGTFQAGRLYAIGVNVPEILVADLNGDGRPDIAAANRLQNCVSVLLNAGGGLFGAAVHNTALSPSFNTRGIFLADLNRDGKLDIVAAGSKLETFMNAGDGTFPAANRAAYDVSPTLSDVVAADFNGDGIIDVAGTSLNAFDLNVLLGTGTGAFTLQGKYKVGSMPNSMVTGDYNGDGKQDIAITHGAGTVAIMLNIGSGSQQRQNQTITFGALPPKTYGDAPFALTATASSGLPVSYSVVSGPATVSGSMLTITGAGNVTVRASQAGNAQYFPAPTVDRTFTVAKKALTVTADNKTKGYGSVLPLFTATYTGFVNGDTAAVLNPPVSFSTTATMVSPVGSYPIVPSGAGAANYSLTYVNGTLTVVKAALTVNIDSKSKVYGAPLPTLTATYTGFVGNDTAASVLNPAPTFSTTATAASPAGTYAITGSGGAAANYTLTIVNGTLTITKAVLTATIGNKSKVYGAALPAFTATYSGFVNGDTVAAIATAPTFSTTATAASSAGTYAITGSGGSAANYTFTFVNGTLTITKAVLTATIDNKSKVYLAALPAFTATYSGFVNGDTAAAITTAPTFSATATAASPVGTYPITGSGGAAANYTFTFVNGTLTITKATPTITWNNPADIIEGTALSSAQLNATASVAGAFVYTPPAGTVLAVGLQQPLGTNFTPTDSTNYNPASKAVFINVLPANKLNQTITFGTLANKTYGDAPFTLSATASSGLAASFSVVSGPATISGTTLTMTGAGDVSVRADQAGNAIYNPAPPVTRTFNVAKKALTITAQDKTRVYGVANPGLTVSYSGFVNGDTSAVLNPGAIVTTTANATSPVGTYPINASSAGAANYTISYAAGTLTITRATPVITWTSAQLLVAGDALSSAQLSATANVPGTFVYSPPAGTVLQAGTHILSVTFTPADGTNYTTATKSVSLTVNANRPPMVTASGSPLTGTAPLNVAFTATASDPDNDALTYAWNFADATPAGSGANPAHTFIAAGTYNVTVTVQDTHGGSATASVTVVVTKPVTGGGIKTGTFKPLNVSKFSALVKAPSSGKDSLSLSGTLSDIPSDFTAAGEFVQIEIGGAVETFVLDSKGRGKSGSSTLSILKKKKRGTTTVTYSLKMKNGSWNDAWKEHGLNIVTDAPFHQVALPVHQVVLPVNLTLDDVIYEGAADAKCSAKAGQGKLKK